MALICTVSITAANVVVKMNSTSKTMTLKNKATGKDVAVGEPSGQSYTFEAEAGEYVLTSYGSDGTTVNGTIELTVTDEAEQTFTVFTCTAYATNKKKVIVEGEEKDVNWEAGTDYTISATVASREGVSRVITLGNSTTAGLKTFNMLSGDSYRVQLIPSDEHAAEGYLTFTKSGTVTFNVTASGAIPMGADYTVSVPADAELFIGTKSSHFVDFEKVEPKSVVTEGNTKRYNYFLASGQQYNYRTWKEGGITNAGIFTMNTDETKRPSLAFTDADYTAVSPKYIDRDVMSNKGYNVADIFVNINGRGHLKMNVGDKYDALAMRSWEVVESVTGNYFIEPDFHYTVLNEKGEQDNSVLSIEQEPGSAWATINAKKDGTAIVLVGYDAIIINQYKDATKSDMVGGSQWSAIWPENTAAYVVTVGQGETGIKPNMTVNAGRNTADKKLSGDNVDAELDVFYYTAGTDGYAYTFKPEGVSSVTVAYPEIGETGVKYSGFAAEGVTANKDGSYTILLKQGRQIVKLTSANGASEYQVLTAKEVSYTVSNTTTPESKTFKPGDGVEVKFNTLYHPANKLAGIHNFRAAINYSKVPEGVELGKATADQYKFASNEKAQTMTLTLPSEWNSKDNVMLSDGSINITFFGDPLGNHRSTSRKNGRNPNFTAVQQNTYLCVLPEIEIPIERPLAVATLEDVDLPENSHKPQLTEEYDEVEGFQSGDFWFDSNVMSFADTWWGYGVANHTATQYISLDDQFNSCTGKGVDNSANYGVAYVSDFMGPVYVTLSTTDVKEVPGVYVTNAAYSYTSMLNGDGYAKKFDKGDWFKLTATGYDDNEEITGTKDFYLADYRSENKDDWYILNDWAYIDLSSLGKVRQIRFTLSSSDNGTYGMNTPAYFCYDNLGAEGTEVAPEGNYNDITSAIGNVNVTRKAPVQRFDLLGRKLNRAQRGLNIIRTEDGRVIKVMKK